MSNSVIGQVVKEERQRAHMTVGVLADLVPADDRTIFRYEADGNIRPDVLARLAQVLKSKRLADCYCQECPVKKVRLKAGSLPWQEIAEKIKAAISDLRIAN